MAISLGFAISIGVPLGIIAARPGTTSQLILGTVGVIYTIPSLALLAALAALPVLGISGRTAVVALFLYSLLPIVRNTTRVSETSLSRSGNRLRSSASERPRGCCASICRSRRARSSQGSRRRR